MAHLVASDVLLRGAAVRLDLAPRLPPVRGDRVQFQQVLLNLVVNALDAVSRCPPDARLVVVRTREGEAGEVEISVEDAGRREAAGRRGAFGCAGIAEAPEARSLDDVLRALLADAPGRRATSPSISASTPTPPATTPRAPSPVARRAILMVWVFHFARVTLEPRRAQERSSPPGI